MRTLKALICVMVATFLFGGCKTATVFEQFSSKNSGICVSVPNDMTVESNQWQLIVMKSSDITFSVHTLYTENLTEDALKQGLTDVAKEGGCDIDAMSSQTFANKSVSGTYYKGSIDQDHSMTIGTFAPNGNDAVLFMFTLTYTNSAAEDIATMIGSLEFDASIIE